MLAQRRRRWANIKQTLGQHLVFAGELTIRKTVVIIKLADWLRLKS